MDRVTDRPRTATPAESNGWIRRLARALMPLVTTMLTLQPAAFAAPSPSLLSQAPMFLDVAVPANVIFLMDDSSSMNDTRLPLPAGLTPPDSSAGCPAGQVRIVAGLCVPRDEWVHRASALNPLYYNPAITYRPWNDNGREGLSGAFQNANSGASAPNAQWFREGFVQHDMRYAGPNYQYGVGNNFTRRITTRGANPPVGAGYPAGRPANDGFQGTASGGLNQDIFSSPFRWVTSVAPTCPAPFAASSAPRPFAARAASPRPYDVRTTSARGSAARSFNVRTDQPPVWALPSSVAPNTTDLDVVNRTITDRTITDRTITDRTISDRTLIDRGFSARTITDRPLEYRQETGVCGVWTAWSTVGPPPPAFCVDPSGEGNSRAANTETRRQPCPGGTSTYSDTQCISNCPGGTTADGTVCRNDCPGGFGPHSNPLQCISACPGGTTTYGTTQCIANCPGGTVTYGATQCITNCPGGTANYGATQCIANCDPVTQTVHSATQCISNCPGGYGAIAGNQCRQNCGGTVVAGGPTGWQCQTCASGTLSGGQCLSCPSGTLATNPLSGQPECRVCPAGTSWVGAPTNACRTDCTMGQTAAVYMSQNVCFNACPGTHPATGTGANLGTCYAACPAGSAPVSGDPASVGFTQCRTDCTGSQTPGAVGGVGDVCFNACPGGTSTVGGFPADTCYANCGAGETAGTAGSPAVPVCFQDCPSPAWLSGGNCRSCPAGSSRIGATNDCCADGTGGLGNCPSQVPTGAPWGGTCTTTSRFYPDLSQPALAHYYVFEPVDMTRAPTAVELSDPANYRRVQINRDAPAFQASFSTPFIGNDPTRGRAERQDCAALTTCTWTEEAQNFANWFTYYRTRMLAAIGVTAESLSKLTSASGLDVLRLGYGSINYFPGGQDPYAANPALTRLPAQTVDGQSSVGAIVRGVRPFAEVTPPPAPGSNDRRQEVFDWLFSIRALGSTPNREALDSVGRYLTRTDNRGPWIEPSGPAAWVSAENPVDHISCRRNYAILVTDGEWTRIVPTDPPQQPLIEQRTNAGLPGAFVASQGYAPTTALTTPGPLHTGTGVAAGKSFQWLPAAEPSFTNVTGSPTATLSDVTVFWWSRDLRPDLPNNIKPIEPSAFNRGNEAFWQHLVPFIVGYGISASRDNAATRSVIGAGGAITWPGVVMENRPTEVGTLVTDQDVFPRPPDPGPDRCQYHPSTNPSGCGRVDDTFRAAMAARADFLAASDVGSLAQSVAAAFQAIGETEGSATALTGRSASLQAGDLLYLASFITARWTGELAAYRALDWFAAVRAGAAEPAPVWRASFPAAGSRVIMTSKDVFAGGFEFRNFAELDAAQQAAVVNQNVLDYLRGDQSRETTAGGPYRRRQSLLGDIVNSSPIYSKAPDFGYSAGRQPAAGGGPTYRAYVTANAHPTTGRRAALYVGANAGMFHAFDALDGRELFAYVPRGVYPYLYNLTGPGYVHRYFVDGPVVEGDVHLGGAWRTTVVGHGGAGFKGAFALNVTRPEAFAAADVMWDITGDDHPDVGHIMAPGIIGSARDGEWYYFVGNGVESANDKARLLAINMRTGGILSLVTDAAGGPNPNDPVVNNRPNGLGGVTPVYDLNRNIVALYAGDRLGRLWKFDLSAVGANLSGYVTTRLFTATDGGGNPQPITAAPRISPHPLGGRYITFGTGKFYDRDDKPDMSVQAVYALWEKNPNSPVTINRPQLRQLTLDQPAALPPPGTPFYRSLNGTSAIDWTTDLGWYFELRVGAGTGERVIVSPTENLGYVNITSYEPLAGGDPCQGGGLSFFYRLDIASTFRRGAFSGRPANEVGVSMAPMLGAPTLMTSGNVPSAAQQPSLSAAELPGLLTNRNRSVGANPCPTGFGRSTLNAAQRAPDTLCEVPSLRTWRELPRR
jgi:type IV pilus assembly protein PilY1